MSYAVMPLSDYKAACDKVREKVDLTMVKFEETDFGYLRSEVFSVPKDGIYIFSCEFSSLINLAYLYYANPQWQGDSSPGYFESIDSNSAQTASKLYAGVQYRIFISDSLGLTPKDILKATLSIDEEVVADFVPPPKIKSGELAEKVDKVYEAGQKAEYDRFWDLYQDSGNRTAYDNAFAGVGWTDETFNPKYPIVPTSAYMMFRYAEITKDIFDRIDLSQSTNNAYMFYGAKFKSIRVDLSGALSIMSVFGHSAATETINLKISDEGVKATDCFVNMKGLKNLTIEGVIAEGNINIASSTLLTAESAKSLITALKDISGTDNAYKYKVTFSPATKTLLDTEGTTAPNGDTWLNYLYAKGWNR